ncbi:MAG: hypothetical protein RL238_644 [Actinomycetota bacterium]|jgi:hypothetical protein
MSEPSTDEKIQQLVRSVLLAVDSRLDAVRHELAVHAAEEEQRHHQVLGTIASLERRLSDLERSDATRRTSSTNVLERLDELNVRIDMLAQHGAAPPPAVTGTHEVVPPAPDLDRISRPLFQAPHVTTQVPIVPPITVEAEPEPAPAPAVEPAPDAEPEPEIDVDRLTALLSEKLGHFSLSPRTD